MDVSGVVDFFLHVDEHLLAATVTYGAWIYAILFVVVFCETGLVVTPFLPGDSLLFATGAICALGDGDGLSLAVILPLLTVASILGDAANYRIGRWLGPDLTRAPHAPRRGLMRFLKPEHLARTQAFYERYGGKTIVLARFVPIVRTFAPFVAGIGGMDYRRFALFNVVGAIAWVFSCTLAGFFFGELPFVKKHFELVVLGIVFVSVLPIAVELVLQRVRRARAV